MIIEIDLASTGKINCKSVIVIPAKALDDATYIRSFTTISPVHSKHEFHTLAQIALIEFDDGEIKPQKIVGKIGLTAGEEIFCLESGMIICRLESEEFSIYMNTDESPRKYFETANRYCTRWVRLDI